MLVMNTKVDVTPAPMCMLQLTINEPARLFGNLQT